MPCGGAYLAANANCLAMMKADKTLKDRGRKWLVALVALALLLGAARLLSAPPSPTDNQTLTWWPTVLSVAQGQGFRACAPFYFPFCGPGNDISAMREPLPVLIFAAVVKLGGSVGWAGVVQMLMQALMVILVHRIALEVAGERIALLAAAGWALYLPAYMVVAQIGGDVVATLAMMLAMWCYLRAWRSGKIGQWALAGLCMGLAVVSRSALLAVALPLVLGLVWHVRHKEGTLLRFRPVVVFGAALAITMAPWVVRNALVFDRLIVGTTLNGYNILRHNDQLPTDRPFRYVGSVDAAVAARSALARHPELTGNENEAEVDLIYRAEGLAIVKANKLRYLELCAYRFFPLWFNWGVFAAYNRPTVPLDVVMGIQQGLLLLFAFIGLRHAPRRTWPLLLGVVVLSLAYMAIVARMRYLLPVMPMVIILACIGVDRMLGANARYRRWWAGMAAEP